MSLSNTGEYFVPGAFSKRIEDEHLERYRFATQFVKEKTVLDIACGVGYGTSILANAGANRVDGVDISMTVVQHAQLNYGSSKLQFLQGDVTKFGTDATYDIVTSFETIEHVKDYNAAISNLYRVLKPNGFLIVSTPNRPMSWKPGNSLSDKPRNPYHAQEFNLEEFCDLIRTHGFALETKDILGQRQFRYIKNRYIKKLYMLLSRPEDRSSPMVEALREGVQPKYIVLIARKYPYGNSLKTLIMHKH